MRSEFAVAHFVCGNCEKLSNHRHRCATERARERAQFVGICSTQRTTHTYTNNKTRPRAPVTKHCSRCAVDSGRLNAIITRSRRRVPDESPDNYRVTTGERMAPRILESQLLRRRRRHFKWVCQVFASIRGATSRPDIDDDIVRMSDVVRE